MLQKKILLVLLLSPLSLSSIELLKDYLHYDDERPLSPISNDLLYGKGEVTEITSEINEYENITANTPIRGSLFVTHDKKNKIDSDSFKLGDKKLKVAFVQSSQISPTSNIIVSIYSFQLDGLPVGIHILPPIKVKVGGEEFHALPLNIEVSTK